MIDIAKLELRAGQVVAQGKESDYGYHEDAAVEMAEAVLKLIDRNRQLEKALEPLANTGQFLPREIADDGYTTRTHTITAGQCREAHRVLRGES